MITWKRPWKKRNELKRNQREEGVEEWERKKKKKEKIIWKCKRKNLYALRRWNYVEGRRDYQNSPQEA